MIPVDNYLIGALPELWFAALLFAFGMYVLLDGFDFGIGMLYGVESGTTREVLFAVYEPVWKANEVWIVAFGTLLVAVFPATYAALLSGHYLLVFGFIFAIFARGLATKFRDLNDDADWQRACNRAYVGGSAIAPFCLGTLAGGWVFGTGTLGAASLATGVVVVTLSLLAGAAYAAMKTRDAHRETLLGYARPTTAGHLGALGVLVAALLATNPVGAGAELLGIPALPLAVLAVGFPVAGLVFAERGRAREWAGCVAGGGLSIVVLLASLLYPYAYPATGTTIREAVVAPVSLNLLTLIGGPFLLIVCGYFVYLYGVFAGPVDEDVEYGY
ncbi:cytochrome d ubiquinol oxidase subunit II [Halorubrum gandharaense]